MMWSLKLIVPILLVVVVFILDHSSVVHGQGMTCKEVVSSLTKRQLSGMGKCAKGMTFKNKKDKSLKSNCILKCVMIAESLLLPDGTVTNEAFEAFMVKEKMGDEMKTTTRKLMGVCVENHASELNPDSNADEYCKSYDGFIKCMMGAFVKLCA